MTLSLKRNTNYFSILLFLIVFVLFFLLERFSPFINDDLRYSFMSGADGIVPVRSISDALKSQIYGYQNTNGRFFVHVLVQWFCGLKLITAYRLASSFMFTMLFFGFLRLVKQKYGLRKSDVIIILLALLIGTPSVGVTFLGNIACGINYLWVSAVIVWLLALFFHLKGHPERRSLPQNLLIFAAGLFSSALQESFSIPLAGALFVYFCFNRQDFRGSMRYLFLGVAVGTAFVVLAPSNFSRAAEMHDNGSSFIAWVPLQMSRLLSFCIVTDILVLCLIIAFFASRRKCLEYVRDNSLLLIANVISLLFMMFVALTGAQQTTCTELFSMILLYNLFRTYCSSWYSRRGRALAWTCLVCLSLLYAYAYVARDKAYLAYVSFCLNAESTKDGDAVGEEYHRLHRKSNALFRRFTRLESFMYPGLSASYNKTWLSASITDGKDTAFIRHVLPLSKEKAIKGCNSKNKVSDCVYWLPEAEMYVVRLPKDAKPQEVKVWIRRSFLMYAIDRLLHRQGWLEAGRDYREYENFSAGGFSYYFMNSDRATPVMQVSVKL